MTIYFQDGLLIWWTSCHWLFCQELWVLLMWNSLETSSNVLMTWHLNSSRVTDLREQRSRGTVSYDLALEVAYTIFYWSHKPNLAQYARKIYKVLNIRSKDLWSSIVHILLFDWNLILYIFISLSWLCIKRAA